MTPGRLVWWILTLLWAGKIFWFSTENFSGEHSGAHLRKLLSLLHLTVSPYAFQAIHAALRKAAHLFEYAVFGVLIYRSLLAGDNDEFQPRLAKLAVLLAAAYSLTDELHQAFVRGRGASLVDCAIDTSGAILGLLLAYGGERIIGSRIHRSPASYR